MSQEIKTINLDVNAETTDSTWKSLYRVGGAAALIATVLFLSDVIVLTTGGSMLSSAQS
ncbi:MAG: hypothetical protein P8X95_14415 [Anaerolineales bacterium]|jgi:hypothetical protein